MNHLLKILLFVPLFVSCTTSQEDVPMKEEEQVSIGFNAKVNSRALADIDDVKTNGFSVWGGYRYIGGTETVFNGDTITFGNASSIITDKYWTYNTYNFYAVYPSTTAATYNVADNTFTINNYNVNNTEDLLCASATHTYPYDGSTVSLGFKHLLTNISVSFQKAADNKYDEIIVTGVHLIGMYTQGDYTRTTSTEAWTDFQVPFYISVSDLSIPVNENPTLCASDMLVMPQPITENTVAFYITYTYSQQGSSVVAQSKSLTTYLPADISVDNPTWVIGKKVNYIGTIHVDNFIEFSTPIVETWGAEQVGGTIIIK